MRTPPRSKPTSPVDDATGDPSAALAAAMGISRAPQEPAAFARSAAGNEPRPGSDQRPPVEATESAADGVRVVGQMLRNATGARWPMYLRNVKQILRSADATFDERRYGFVGLMDLLKACSREGLVRLERDRRGGLRVFQGPALKPAAPLPERILDVERAGRSRRAAASSRAAAAGRGIGDRTDPDRHDRRAAGTRQGPEAAFASGRARARSDGGQGAGVRSGAEAGRPQDRDATPVVEMRRRTPPPTPATRPNRTHGGQQARRGRACSALLRQRVHPLLDELLLRTFPVLVGVARASARSSARLWTTAPAAWTR